MPKSKGSKQASIPNKALYSRLSYLYQAAAYLAENGGNEGGEDSASATSSAPPLSRYLLSQLHDVSLKSQIRLSPDIKHTICKRCRVLLKPGETSTARMENKSRGGQKPWADVLVLECRACGTEKRFPVGAERQARRSERVNETEHEKPDSTRKNATSTVPDKETK